MEIKYKNCLLKYSVKRKNVKNISIKIEQDGNLLITCPMNITITTVEKIIKRKIKWITAKLEIMDKKNSRLSELQPDKLKYLLFLGKVLPVKKCNIDIDKPYVEFGQHEIDVYGNDDILSNMVGVKRIIYRQFKKKLQYVIEKRIDIYSRIIKVKPNKITIKAQKTIWGSCSSKGNLNFNYRLIMAPLDVIDYVVVHELCHLVHMNHSKEYWKLVESIIPDYNLKKNWLNDNGYIINIDFR